MTVDTILKCQNKYFFQPHQAQPQVITAQLPTCPVPPASLAASVVNSPNKAATPSSSSPSTPNGGGPTSRVVTLQSLLSSPVQSQVAATGAAASPSRQLSTPGRGFKVNSLLQKLYNFIINWIPYFFQHKLNFSTVNSILVF